MKCIIENCGGTAVSRGLCPKCYAIASKQVSTSNLSWEQLIFAGLALPLTNKNRHSPFGKAYIKQFAKIIPRPEKVSGTQQLVYVI